MLWVLARRLCYVIVHRTIVMKNLFHQILAITHFKLSPDQVKSSRSIQCTKANCCAKGSPSENESGSVPFTSNRSDNIVSEVNKDLARYIFLPAGRTAIHCVQNLKLRS